MKRAGWPRMLAAAIVVSVGLSCGEGPTAPVPGTLVVSLTTPNSDDGAILLTMAGAGIGAPTAVSSSHVLFFRVTSTTSLTAVVVGNIAAGPLLSFAVPDVGAASSYTATITEVAARDNALRASLSGYTLSVSR